MKAAGDLLNSSIATIIFLIPFTSYMFSLKMQIKASVDISLVLLSFVCPWTTPRRNAFEGGGA